MHETFTIIITIDRDRLRVGMENVYRHGLRLALPTTNHKTLAILNEFILLYLHHNSNAFGEVCIHLVRFAPLEESINVN